LARALPQAALAGLPAITYDIDGAKEAVQDQQTGFVLPPFDRAELSRAMAVLLSDAALCREMGRRGREFALSRFDAAVMVDSLEKLYSSIV
jgi:glycosyltransferase involved in cell wall biosynthesis